MAGFVHSEFLFAEAYLQQVLRKCQDGPALAAFAQTLREWRREQDRTGAASLLESYVGPVLDTTRFVRRGSPSHPGLAQLLPSHSAEKPVGLCLVVDPDSTIGCTRKGMHWAEKLIRALREAGAPWGILTDGETWRLYCASELSPYDTYLEIRLGEAIDAHDADALRLFHAFFGAEAFAVDAEGQPRLEAHRCASAKVTQEIEKHLRAQVDEVLRWLCMGFVRQEGKESFTEEERKTLFDNAVTLLYRIMFMLYAESRRLLPVDHPTYRPHSLAALTEKAVELHFHHDSDRAGRDLWEHLRTLYVWIDEGHRRTPDEDFEIAEYDGELFDADQHPYLTDHWMTNQYIGEALYHLTCLDDPHTPGQCRRIDYRDLSVRHLGSLYEAILEYKLYIAEEPMVARASGDKVQFLPRSAVQPKQSDALIPKGGVYFAQQPQERKQSGSYYTPEDVVEYIVANTVDKGLDDRWQEFAPRQREMLEAVTLAAYEEERLRLRAFCDRETERFIREKVLTYRVLDPAMGSGHFLVNALHHLTNFVVAKLNETPWPNSSLDSAPIIWRRRIVERCLYGVDINPLAAELAKLSLWLASASVGRPLSFLAHHLQVGNSLLGARIQDLASAPNSKEHEGDSLLPSLFTTTLQSVLEDYRGIASVDSDEMGAVEEKKGWVRHAQRALTRIQDIAHVWLSAYFGNPVSDEAYATLLSLATQGHSEAAWENIAAMNEMVRQARVIAARERFFHWELQFPDALEDGKCQFHAVIANPPYVATKPDTAIRRLYQTAKCGDLYGYFVALSCQLPRNGSRIGMIVPLSLLFSGDFRPLRALLLNRGGEWRFVCLDNNTDAIFQSTPGTRNSQRATVVLAQLDPDRPRIWNTNLLRWTANDRPRLFGHIEYANVTAFCSEQGFPKIGDPRLVEFYARAAPYPRTLGALSAQCAPDAATEYLLYVPSAARYFITAWPAPLKKSEVNAFRFADEWSRNLAFLAVNSNVFYWLWCVIGDGFHVTRDNVEAMWLPDVPKGDHETGRLCDALTRAAADCATYHAVEHGRKVPNYNFNKRMDILLAIDDWIVRHIAPDLDLPRDIFAQYKSHSFLRPLDLSALANPPEEEE